MCYEPIPTIDKHFEIYKIAPIFKYRLLFS